MVDIEIMLDPLSLNLETNLILYLYPKNVYKIQPIRVAFQKPENLKFCAPFKMTIQKRGGLSNFEKQVFDFSVLYPKKRD